MHFHKHLNVLVLMVLIASNIQGQEINNQNDSISKNLEKSQSGIEIRIEGPYSEEFSYGSTMSPIFLDYLREIKMSKTATLILKGGGFILPKSLDKSLYGQTISKPLIGNESNYLNFGLNFVIEPRWYWKVSKKTLSGKVKQISGWYLSFPFESNIPIDLAIKTVDENYGVNGFENVTWVKDFLRFYYNMGPGIGYKYALSKNWYFDAMIQIKAHNYFTKNNENYIYGKLEINPHLEIKAAYVFSK